MEGRPGYIGQTFSKTLIVLGTVVGLYVLFQLRGIVLLLFGAILFASTIRPIVLALEARGIRRIFGILLVYAAFILALLASAGILLPTLLLRAQELVGAQDKILQSLVQTLQRVQLFAFGQAQIWLPIPAAADMQKYLAQLQTEAQQRVSGFMLDGFRAATEILLLFVMAFYWLTERDRLEEFGLRMIPLRNRATFLAIFDDIESTLGAYLRGQAILSLSVAVLSFAGLAVLGMPYALLLAAFFGVAELIPFVGPLIGVVPAVLLALMVSPQQTLLVVLLYIVIQQLESNVLVPKIMERQVGLSPLVVILALAAGNVLAGLLGALLAVPVAGALQVLVRHLVIMPTVEAHAPTVVEGGVLIGEAPETVTVETSGPVTVVQGSPAGVQTVPGEVSES